jgi:hypothetical protein
VSESFKQPWLLYSSCLAGWPHADRQTANCACCHPLYFVVQDSLPPKPKEKDMEKAQVRSV